MGGDAPASHRALITRVLDQPGVVVVLGGVDTGKTTLAVELLRAGAEAGLRGALLDTDVGQSTVGPPTTIGLRHVTRAAALDDPFPADACHFVGAISPAGRFLPLVTGAARLVDAARAAADLVVVDTSGLVAGLAGQTLKFHKLELTRPDHVVGLQHSDELEPVLTTARGFTRARVHRLPVSPDSRPVSAAARADTRAAGLARYFAAPRQGVSVEDSVFAPCLPRGFDEARLDGLLVGLDDGTGTCQGIGFLTHDDDRLALSTPAVAATPPGVRLGAVRVAAGWYPDSVDLRALLATS